MSADNTDNCGKFGQIGLNSDIRFVVSGGQVLAVDIARWLVRQHVQRVSRTGGGGLGSVHALLIVSVVMLSPAHV